jgi:eukaryotic-like serine/threonine-protein kinase
LRPSKNRHGTQVDALGHTLFLPRGGALVGRDSRPGRTLPPDLREQVARRLRLVALTYSLAFFCADLVPPLAMGEIGMRFASPGHWVPTVASIVMGLLVAGLVSRARMSWEAKLNIGLVFEVASSYGIALAQYHFLPGVARTPVVLYVLSPSWVAIWMIVFSIVVPAPPRKALLALIASASAPPVVIWFALHNAGLSYLSPPPTFFFQHIFPYMICVALGYVGARIVYTLGGHVTRARELGSYHLIERLGQGGMGEVWRATHQLLARPAAIKFIRPQSIAGSNPEESQKLLKRFELEARATASLSSAHTINLYDFGVTDDGTFYYVMELLDGLDCDRMVRRFGPLPAARVVHLMAQICESLEEAHDKGLIHRDVKPANIYVCRAGNRYDFVKVLDFGLVARVRAPAAAELRLTLPEQAIGTPEFMPPEVALGQEIDRRTDLYGLGCVAYWLATGKPVFEGSSYFEIVSKHMHEPPDAPSRHAPHPMPRELDALILRCLEKLPERRPANAHDLAREFRAVPVTEPWRDEHAEAWWGGHSATGLNEDSQPTENAPSAPVGRE